ncbi:hypothetical protein AVEN_135111-1 [Araneus ventricosus]|uniref:Uncharacterized protein n=1 Tax=Araneus ventricosus TaxID=182803 RepID=A0A4Y2JP25_ARAVE|nr:hypothetical protein AVEN_135111-1 [Araneus ventricosus]
MSRFEAKRRLFLDGPCNFVPRSGDKDDTKSGDFSPTFRTTPTGGRLATTYDLTCYGPHIWWIFGEIGCQTWNLLTQKSKPYH